MTTVDRLNIEIVANQPLLDRNMRAAERRVDAGATRMARSIDRVERRVGGIGAGRMGSRLGRFGMQAFGIGLGGAFLHRNMEQITIGLNSVTGGVVRAIGDLSTGIDDFGGTIRKNLPMLERWGRYWGNLADEAYAAFAGIAGPGQGRLEMDTARSIQEMNQDADLDIRAANATTEQERRQIEYDRRMLEIAREQAEAIKNAPPEWAHQIVAVFDKQREVARIERDKPLAKKDAQASFDAIQTAFGQMRIANRFKGQQSKQEEPAKEKTQEEMAKDIGAILDTIKKVLGTGFVPFA